MQKLDQLKIALNIVCMYITDEVYIKPECGH